MGAALAGAMADNCALFADGARQTPLGWPLIEGRGELTRSASTAGRSCRIHHDVGDRSATGSPLRPAEKRWRPCARPRPVVRLLRAFGIGSNGFSLLNLFPLPRQSGFRRSFHLGEAVDRGYSVLVFPEGRHTTDGKMNPFRAGIGLLAVNLGIPVLPMRIDGLFE